MALRATRLLQYCLCNCILQPVYLLNDSMKFTVLYLTFDRLSSARWHCHWRDEREQQSRQIGSLSDCTSH